MRICISTSDTVLRPLCARNSAGTSERGLCERAVGERMSERERDKERGREEERKREREKVRKREQERGRERLREQASERESMRGQCVRE